ncbi:MAG: purine-nucleoside phosphorylase [Actinomycetota bacterium]
MPEPASPGDDRAEEGAAAVRERSELVPAAAVVSGSGLSGAFDLIDKETEIDYGSLPGFPGPTTPGHSGRLVLGKLSGVPVAAFLGRIHYYEGNPIRDCALPVRLARALGATTMFATAATGGVNTSLAAGTIVVVRDHLNFLGVNPLHGWRTPEGSAPFVDTSALYDPALTTLALESARELGVAATSGVYAALPGPSYETPSEVEFLRRSGADVVGMSVVTETIPAAALGMRVAALAAVVNPAGARIDHTEVLRVGGEAAAGIGRLLEDILPRLAREEAANGL